MPYTTVALVNEVAQAQAVADELHAAGFPSDAISLVFPERHDPDLIHFAPTTPTTPQTPRSSGNTWKSAEVTPIHPEGLAATIVPGLGRLFATGPILTILSGVGVRTSSDSMVKTLIEMGLAPSDARHCTSCLGLGQILIAVRTDEESCSLLVSEIIRHHGGRDISRSAWPIAEQRPFVPA